MAVTPFLKLQKPPFDTIPWDQAVNGNMDTIDAFIARYMAVPNYVGAWANGVSYVSGQNVLDITNATIYLCQVTHTSSAAPTTFSQDRTTYPTYWLATTNVTTGAGTSLTITEVTPASAKSGDLWWNSAEGQLYILYNDGNSMQWVIANNQAGNIGDAPRDGSIYGRQMGAWVASQSIADVGRNLLHNGRFNVAQRGTSFTTTVGVVTYTADRWAGLASASGDVLGVTVIAHSDANRAQIGDEDATQFISVGFTGGAGAANFVEMFQRIENVRRTAGKAVTVSFWANMATAPQLGVNLSQSFGTGGSPSAVVVVGAKTVTLTGTLTRYSLTFVMPSIAGKTLGTNNDSSTQLEFWFSSGANNAARAGVGVQSGTTNIWGVQLEIGSIATPLEKPDPRYDLANCQRFYQQWYCACVTSFTTLNPLSPLAVPMRATPTLTVQGISQGSGAAFTALLNGAVYQSTANSLIAVANGFASADL